MKKTIICTLLFSLLTGLLSCNFFEKKTKELYLLDGPGMVYEGAPLDDALSGSWYSENGRYALEADGKFASFSVDGTEIHDQDHGYFFDHNFCHENDLNERNELSLFGGPEIKDEDYKVILSIEEMWYQADHIYMNITWPEGEKEEVVFFRGGASLPEGEWESDQAGSPEGQPSMDPQAPQPQVTMELEQGEDYMAVTFDTLPTTLEEFSLLAEGKLTDPENTCALFLCALNLFVQDVETGSEALNILKGPQPLSNYDISWFKDRLRGKSYLPYVYFEGASPQNNYIPAQPYTVKFYPDPRPEYCQEGYQKLFVKNAGFDSPRYFLLRQKGGNWYIWEVYSVMMGVKTPAKENRWA